LTSTKALEVQSVVQLLTKVLKTFCLFFTIGVTPDQTNLVIAIKSETTQKMEDTLPADNAQNFFTAHGAAQFAILQQLSNKLSEDKFTAAQWLAKVVNHNKGAQWNDA
jgi:hypothetical protein